LRKKWKKWRWKKEGNGRRKMDKGGRGNSSRNLIKAKSPHRGQDVWLFH
jgi:hypothetical protein